jgi:hypothetical protein
MKIVPSADHAANLDKARLFGEKSQVSFLSPNQIYFALANAQAGRLFHSSESRKAALVRRRPILRVTFAEPLLNAAGMGSGTK